MAFRHLKGIQLSADSARKFDADNFVTVIDNPYFTLQPGTTFISKSPDGSEVVTVTVTRRTIDILGVTCVVVEDTVTEDGEVLEKTFDYFAQDKDGNVWYFGEDTKEFEDGKVVSTEGTWRAGVDGAKPGFIMLASPRVGDEYDQERAPGVAEDHAEVLSVNETIAVPYGRFDHVLQTAETTPLEPDVLEHKFYAPNLGFVLAFDVNADERTEQLVKIRFEGTAADDTLTGNVGTDELIGRAGDDRLNGLGGSDRIRGGSGCDRIKGGKDEAADFLYGGNGNDRIDVDTADRAFGGAGNDLMRLFDNDGFGAVRGGGQQGRNLARTGGDVLKFDGQLDLAADGLNERISGIETLSMRDKRGNDSLRLSVEDVLDLGTGEFNPSFCGADALGKDDAVRVDGNHGDELSLAGGNWSEIKPNNAPHGYDLFASQATTGNAYVLVQADVTVNLD